ncbi:Longitudinals lacking protein [Armadillidium nasatum]|uniref:Longitudinals lacking protein n=1 Tax=Armadillidium nasatum TaxID=96803 RepID=A0A5N5SK19_9CRUS|nr:Longitudinals lacking protein [Armadillidium nasatum]
MENIERNSQYCVLWNNYHTFLSDSVKLLQENQQFIDVTLVTAEGNYINAHQLVLAACSTFFRSFIKANSAKHPIILLPSDIRFPELKAMVEFMYTGQVCIQQDRLQAFIKGARYFRIKGLEDNAEESEPEDIEIIDSLKDDKSSLRMRKIKYEKDPIMEEEDPEPIPKTTIRGKTMKDHRYTQQVELGDSDDNREKWEVVDRKPVIFPRSKKSLSVLRKRKCKISCDCKVPVHLSNNVVCYEQKYKLDEMCEGKEEPINKVRRPGFVHDICNCASRKIWSVKDTEALLKAWMETLNQVKMKNLRREVRLYKEQIGRSSKKTTSAVANACEKLLTSIEDIFNKEEAIRQEWYQKKTERRLKEDGMLDTEVTDHTGIIPQDDVLGDSDLCDEDTDMHLMETEGEGEGVMTENEGGPFTEGEDDLEPYENSRRRTRPSSELEEGTVVHHIVEDISFQPLQKDRHRDLS